MMSASSFPAWSVGTQRLLLRPWSSEDAPAVREALDRSSEHLRPWVPFMKDEPRTLRQTETWLERRRQWFEAGENFPYAMLRAEDASLVGEMTLMKHPSPREFEIGYWVDVNCTGERYACEGTAALTRLAFEYLGAELIEINLATENRASRTIPERLGYRHECTRARRYVDCLGVRHDLEAFVMFAEDLAGSSCAGSPIEPRDSAGKPASSQK